MAAEKPIETKKRAYGPCGDCVFFRGNETPERHATGRCHGRPPNPMIPGGWPVIEAAAAGCGVFEPR